MRPRLVARSILALCAVVAVTVVLHALGVGSATTVALSYLLVVLFVASSTTVMVAVATAVVAALCLNYFFMAPVGTFTIADPHNWMALVVFLVVALVASQLSSTAKAREREAVERRNEVARLFDLSRDILLTTDGAGATAAIARHVARRFDVPGVCIALRDDAGRWGIVQGGAVAVDVGPADLDRGWAALCEELEIDAITRQCVGRGTIQASSGSTALVPVQLGVRVVGFVAFAGRVVDPGAADAIAGIVAIAIERARFLDERQAAELSRQRADLSSALLAALGHDLRTPLTAIRVAVTNAGDARLDEGLRSEQSALAVGEIDHLARLLQEILDMARIETRAVHADRHWVTACAIVDAAVAHAGNALAHHALAIEADESTELQLDPRLTSAALAHVIENAARYSPAGTTIHVRATVCPEGLRVTVRDEGPGLHGEDLERLFVPFVRGEAGRQAPTGTGLGLAIARGLLAAEGGRVWAERPEAGRGAQFCLAVDAAERPVALEESWS